MTDIPDLKSLSRDSVAAALEKAEHYRLLNEARSAESICLDVLEVEPENQKALTILLLSLTDQFSRDVGHRVREAKELLPRLQGEYHRAYYAGIISERFGKAQLRRGGPGSGGHAYHFLREAMERYEKAERLQPPGNQEATLRWNTCVRLLKQHGLRPEPEDQHPQFLE